MQIKDKDRQKILLIAVVVLGVLWAGNSVIIDPLIAGWHNRDHEIRELKSKYAAGRDLITQKMRLQRQWNEMFNNTLPVDSTVAQSTLLKRVDAWRQSSGVTVEQVTPQEKTEEDTDHPDSHLSITTEECQADATGNIRSILGFLFALETDPLGLKVEDLVVSAKDNLGEELSVGLRMSALVLRPADAPAESGSETNNEAPVKAAANQISR